MESTGKAFLGGLGVSIRKLRIKRRFTQSELAERADITQKYLCEIEAGKRNPSVDCVRRVAKALGVPLSRLLSCAS